MRIQPLEIEVPEDDPFKNDLLGRRETVEVLTGIVRSIEGPCVLSVDAAWGAGKTTFLKIWAQHLRNQEFPVVEFNAWETDFSEEPFIALSTELMEGLKGYADTSLTQKIGDMKEKAKKIVLRTAPGGIRLGITYIPYIGPLLEKIFGNALDSWAEEKLNAYEEAQHSVEIFRHTLKNIANTLSKSKEGRPLVVVIDELDRCRPSYAVELLEVAKHIFAVDHVVFVLGVNRSELAHSVKALYGHEFDASGYLGRFFDLDFHLPEPDRTDFIYVMLQETGINEYLEQIKYPQVHQEASEFQRLLLTFFEAPDLSLRWIAQAIHRLGLVFASLPREQLLFPGMTAAMFVLRTIDLNLYQRFVDDQSSDLEVVDTTFERPGLRLLKGTPEGDLFEFMIIVATYEGFGQLKELPFELSPLLMRYQQLAVKYNNGERSGNGVSPDPGERASEFMERFRRFHDRLISSYSGKVGFKESVQRIELISAFLINGRDFSSDFSSDDFG